MRHYMILASLLSLGCSAVQSPPLCLPPQVGPVAVRPATLSVATSYDPVDRVTWTRPQADAGYHPLVPSVGTPDSGPPAYFLTATYQGVTFLGVDACTLLVDGRLRFDLAGDFAASVYVPSSRGGQLPVYTEQAAIEVGDRRLLDALAKASSVMVRFRGPTQFRQYDLSREDLARIRSVLAHKE